MNSIHIILLTTLKFYHLISIHLFPDLNISLHYAYAAIVVCRFKNVDKTKIYMYYI